MIAVDGGDWLEDTRTSYDTVAAAYAEQVAGALADLPHERAVLTLFAELVGTGGPVADLGCGPGHVTAHLHALGLDACGLDLSERMVTIARREHPSLRFEVASMTDLDIPDARLAGLLAWYSLIHVPDHAVPSVLAGFHRVLRPGAVVLAGFHVGDADHHKTSGYGGHPMSVRVHLRPLQRVADWLAEAGLVVEAQMLRTEPGAAGGDHGYLIARRPR